MKKMNKYNKLNKNFEITKSNKKLKKSDNNNIDENVFDDSNSQSFMITTYDSKQIRSQR